MQIQQHGYCGIRNEYILHTCSFRKYPEYNEILLMVFLTVHMQSFNLLTLHVI